MNAAHLRWRISLSGALCMMAGTALRAADITWNGSAEDAQWGTGANWSNTSGPGGVDRAIFSLTGIPENKRIHLGADRVINELRFTGGGFDGILDGAGEFTLTLNNGNVTGGGSGSGTARGVIACDVILGANGSWIASDVWASMISCYGGISDEGNGYSLNFGGNQNRNILLGGHVNIGGAITISCNSFTLGGAYTDAAEAVHYGGSISGATGIYLDCRMGYNDNFDTTFTIENSHVSDSNRIQDSIPIATLRTGGELILRGNAADPVVERIDFFDLRSGRLNLQVNGAAASVATDLNVGAIDRAQGTTLTLSLSTGGRFIVDDAVNVNGMWQPWCLVGNHFSKVGNDHAILATGTADYQTAAATGNSPAALYNFTEASLALGADASMWGLRMDRTSAQTLDLGEHDLTIGSGTLIVVGNNAKSITSEGGELVFGGEDIVLFSDGTGAFTISAPIAWSKPAGSTVERPSLVAARAGRELGIVLEGEDRIGEYGALFGTHTTRRSIVLGGPSDRTFHGAVNGVVNIVKAGSGTLTFAGPNERRSGSTSVNEGRLVLAHASAPNPTVAAGAYCEIVQDIVFSSQPAILAGGTISGLGRVSTNLGADQLRSGARIAPGAPDTPGMLTLGGHVTPAGDLTLAVRISADTNDNLRVTNNFNKPADGATLTILVSDVSDGAAKINDQIFVVATWGGTLGNLGNLLNLVVANGSPTKLDTTDAVATLDIAERTLTVSLLRSIPGGTLMLVR